MPKLDLWQALERHLRKAVCQLAQPHEIGRFPATNAGIREMSDNIRLYLEILDNQNRALISPRPRRVHFSNSLTSSARYVDCESRLLRIKALLESGSPEINDPKHRFLSKKVETLLKRRELSVFLDRLLLDWGIHHLHLGGERRSDDLLFAVIREDDAYFIKICRHIEIASVHPLEVAQRNWPFLFQYMPQIIGGHYTEDEVNNLRRNNVAYSPDVNGQALMPRGSVTSAGGTLRVVRGYHYLRKVLAWHQESLCTPGSVVRREIATKIGVQEESMHLEVMDHESNFAETILLKEATSGAIINYRFRRISEE